MKLPIIIFEQKCDLMIFNTLKEAESYLEPIDVKNQEYAAFDSEGMSLDIKVEKNKTQIEPTPFFKKETLIDKLTEYLARVKKIKKDELLKLPLADLIILGR